MKKCKIIKKFRSELMPIKLFLLSIFILPMIAVFCYGKETMPNILNSFAINISASALTIFVTMFFIDVKQEKLRNYQGWTKQLHNEIQDTVGHVLKVIDIINSIPRTENIGNRERLESDIVLKLKNFPRTPSFSDHATVRHIEISGPKILSVTEITEELYATSQEIIKEIENRTFKEVSFLKYEARLMGCVYDILSIVPKEFKDIKREL